MKLRTLSTIILKLRTLSTIICLRLSHCLRLSVYDYPTVYDYPRCGVIAGPWQFGKVDQGVFTYWMLAHYFKRPLKYIGFGGKGKQVRDLLHIDDLCRLIGLQVNSLSKLSGNTYNVGGAKEVSLSLSETTALCQKITGNKIKIGKDLRNRPGDIAIYLSSNKKVNKDLKWQTQKPSDTILSDIFIWIRNNEKKLKSLIA